MSIMYLLGVSSHMPSTRQEITLRGQLGDVVSSCAGNLRKWHGKRRGKAIKGIRGYEWSSHTVRDCSSKFFCTVWLLNVWDQSVVGWI